MLRLIGLFLLPAVSLAGLRHHSEDLRVMDIESIQRIVAKNLADAEKLALPVNNENPAQSEVSLESYQLYKHSVELVLARPDQNGATSAVFSSIQSRATTYGGIIKILNDITTDALRALDQDGKDKLLLKSQNTYIHILNNMMEEIRPSVKDKSEPHKKIAIRVRDADIDFSDALKSHRLLNSMKNITNPSKLAEKIVGKKKRSWWPFW